MAFTRITDEDRLNKGVTGLPDVPQLDTLPMQQRFDELANMALDGINRLIGELEESGTDNINIEVPDGLPASTEGTLKSVLDAMQTMINACEKARHDHSNMSVLNSFTESVKEKYDRLADALSGINTVDLEEVTDNIRAVPTSRAVKNYLVHVESDAYGVTYKGTTAGDYLDYLTMLLGGIGGTRHTKSGDTRITKSGDIRILKG